MTQEQANELAEEIREQFGHVDTHVVQSGDMRNAPSNWFIAVTRKEPQRVGSVLHIVEGLALHIHNRYEWQEALDALAVLGAE